MIGFSEAVAERISKVRTHGAFTGVDNLCFRAQLDRKHQGHLAEAGALKGLAGHRARWAVSGVEAPLPLFAGIPHTVEPDVPIPLPKMLAEYVSLGMTLGRHPLAFIRNKLAAQRCVTSLELAKVSHGRGVGFAGIVRLRQRPETASGITS